MISRFIVILISIKAYKMKTDIFLNGNSRIKCVLALLLAAIVIYVVEVNDLFDLHYITKAR